jgi:hypothetical protein
MQPSQRMLKGRKRPHGCQIVPTLQVAEFIWKDHVSEAGEGSQHIGSVKVSIQIHYYWSTWYWITFRIIWVKARCFLIMTRVGYRSSLGPLVQHIQDIHPLKLGNTQTNTGLESREIPWGECWNGGTHTWRGCITSLPTWLKHIETCWPISKYIEII